MSSRSSKLYSKDVRNELYLVEADNQPVKDTGKIDGILNAAYEASPNDLVNDNPLILKSRFYLYIHLFHKKK